MCPRKGISETKQWSTLDDLKLNGQDFRDLGDLEI